jgi:hypothetical protein
MRNRIVKKSALFLAPLTFLLLGSSCDRHFGYSDCWIDDQYQIDCWPDEPEPPFAKIKDR